MEDSMTFGLSTMEGSITPPVSPRGEDFLLDEDRTPQKRSRLELDENMDHIKLPVHFDCSKSHRRQSISWSPSPEGFVNSGLLTSLLGDAELYPGQFEEGTCELFGHTYVTGIALMDNMQHLFSLARQAVSKCERLLGQDNSWSPLDPIAVETAHLRDQVLMFFVYVQTFIQRFDTSSIQQSTNSNQSSLYIQKLVEFPSMLLQELKTLCLYVGKLSDRHKSLIHQYAALQQRQDSCHHMLVHLYLDLQWNVLQALHLLHNKFIGIQQDAIVMFLNDHVELFLQELVTMATIRHNVLPRRDSKEFFVCNCHQELWLILIYFLDHRHGKHSSSSFWGSLHSVLIPVLEENNSDDMMEDDSFPTVNANDKVGLCWWILQNLAPLYQYKMNGKLQTDGISTIRSHWILAEDLLKLFLTKESNADEAKLQCYLKSCLALSHLWEPHNKILIALWDYYSKRLNQRLHIASLGLQNLTSVSKSAQAWFEVCKQRSSDHTGSQGHENSFNIFLRILATQLGKMKVSGNLQGWKQVQGRFYSKFHSRSMKELDEVGLDRFLGLFLTLALVADLSDVSSRVIDFLDLLPQATLTTGKLKLIWRGLFTLCLIHEEHQVDIAVIADTLNKGFEPIAREFRQKGIDSNRKSQLWALICCYIEGTQEVFESSNKLSLSEDKLIGSGFSHLLPACSENEMRILLSFIQTVMARHRSLYKRVLEKQTRLVSSDVLTNPEQLLKKYTDLAQVLWEYVYPFVRQHASTQTPPSMLADVAASFTLLASDMEGQQLIQQPSTPSSLGLFKYFGLENNKAHYSIRVRYLCHLLPNQSFMEKVQNRLESGNWPSLLIRAWFSCAVYVTKPSDQMHELTRLVTKQPELAAILETQVTDMDVYLDSEPAGVLRFIIAAGHYFMSGQNLQEKFSRRQQILGYFGNLAQLSQAVLKNHKSTDEIQWLYKVMGHVVQYCARIIYVKGKAQSQLPDLLNELVLPHVLYNAKKVMPSSMQNAIRDNLHLFLEGLGSLGLERDEFIQRKLQELVVQYLHRFNVKPNPLMSATSSSVSANHPILIALHKSCSRQPSSTDSAFRQFILRVIQQKFLAYQGQSPPPHLSNTVSFLQELFQRTSSTGQLVRDTVLLLGTVLDYMFLCNVASVKRQMSSLLTAMMDACRRDTRETQEQELLSVLRGFLSHHIYVHQGAVLHCLESVAILHPDLVVKLIPDCSRIIGQNEIKRGVGADNQLRNAYCGLLSHLGEAGKRVINRVKNGEDLLL
ncbi:protein MMS22-like [Amphiura filiformis]|uniref:protein MMS22-like n=1 Tax=Amphiura filiformis TaxID=82378 RepID=UPI003B21F8F3